MAAEEVAVEKVVVKEQMKQMVHTHYIFWSTNH